MPQKKSPKIIGNYTEAEKDAPGFEVYGSRRAQPDIRPVQVKEIQRELSRQPVTNMPDMKTPLKKK